MEDIDLYNLNEKVLPGEKSALQTILDRIQDHTPYELKKVDIKFDQAYIEQLQETQEGERKFGASYPDGEYPTNRPILSMESVDKAHRSDRMKMLVDKVSDYQQRLTDSRGLLEPNAIDSQTYLQYVIMRTLVKEQFVDLPSIRQALMKSTSINFTKEKDEEFSKAARIVNDYLKTGGMNLIQPA